MSTREISNRFSPTVAEAASQFIQALMRWYGSTSHDAALWLCWGGPHGGNSVTGTAVGGWYEPRAVEGYLIETAIEVHGRGGEFSEAGSAQLSELSCHGFHQCQEVDDALFAFHVALVRSGRPFLLAFCPHEPVDGPVLVFNEELGILHAPTAEAVLAMGRAVMNFRPAGRGHH